MREGVFPLGKAIDNSQVVRQADPTSNRDLFWLLVLVGTLVAGLAFYAWPHLAARETGAESARLFQERDRLLEENRKLRLEKASLEDLHRVERIATKSLGLVSPPADRIIVVERPEAPPAGARLAAKEIPPGQARN